MNTTKTTKNLSAITFRIITALMILSMLLAGVGIQPASAASTVTISGNAGVAGAVRPSPQMAARVMMTTRRRRTDRETTRSPSTPVLAAGLAR